jgi:hypothetical protein
VLGSTEENALGIKGFDATYLLVLEGLLRGSSVDEIANTLGPNTAIQERSSTKKSVELITKNLKGSPLFSAILKS